MKETAALVLIVFLVVSVSISKTASHNEEPPVNSGGLFGVFTKPPTPQKHVIEISGFKFTTSDIKVHQGDTIQWVNKDIVPHTATADDKTWDSEGIGQSVSWELIAEEGSAGSYFCKYHPTMKGVITIQK